MDCASWQAPARGRLPPVLSQPGWEHLPQRRSRILISRHTGHTRYDSIDLEFVLLLFLKREFINYLSFLLLEIDLRRNFGFYLYKIILLQCLINMFLFSFFALPIDDVANRLNGVVTLLLTSVAFRYEAFSLIRFARGAHNEFRNWSGNSESAVQYVSWLFLPDQLLLHRPCGDCVHHSLAPALANQSRIQCEWPNLLYPERYPDKIVMSWLLIIWLPLFL